MRLSSPVCRRIRRTVVPTRPGHMSRRSWEDGPDRRIGDGEREVSPRSSSLGVWCLGPRDKRKAHRAHWESGGSNNDPDCAGGCCASHNHLVRRMGICCRSWYMHQTVNYSLNFRRSCSWSVCERHRGISSQWSVQPQRWCHHTWTNFCGTSDLVPQCIWHGSTFWDTLLSGIRSELRWQKNGVHIYGIACQLQWWVQITLIHLKKD